ncbi:hypothetical protein [Actinoplanes sp. ATCC 53533]|uniref:hypothetical protein n=1 Tax=Actinoplanes sp. ATCC 53533 TaxID=1288362 RepID=UPI001F3CAB9E|nr:hypothetical protein [Actinoplanes sp. ATCC 53533]
MEDRTARGRWCYEEDDAFVELEPEDLEPEDLEPEDLAPDEPEPEPDPDEPEPDPDEPDPDEPEPEEPEPEEPEPEELDPAAAGAEAEVVAGVESDLLSLAAGAPFSALTFPARESFR